MTSLDNEWKVLWGYPLCFFCNSRSLYSRNSSPSRFALFIEVHEAAIKPLLVFELNRSCLNSNLQSLVFRCSLLLSKSKYLTLE